MVTGLCIPTAKMVQTLGNIACIAIKWGDGDYCGVIMLYNSLPVYPGTICVTYFWSPQLRVREQYAGLLSSSSSSLVLFGEG